MARNYDYNGDPCGEYGAAVRAVGQLREELARLRLTDAEREAIAWFSIYSDTPGEERHAVVLAKLLERTN
jgi:hypothetical protein